MNTKRARYIYMKGWVVEQCKDGKWVRIHEGLTKSEAYWVAYGEDV